jgi:hypothetical protein
MAGNFRFGGALIDAPEASPWTLDPPNEVFRDALHGFTWLGDLAALPKAEGRAKAQEWVLDWAKAHGRGTGAGWTPDLTGRQTDPMDQPRAVSSQRHVTRGEPPVPPHARGGRRPILVPVADTRPRAWRGSRR